MFSNRSFVHFQADAAWPQYCHWRRFPMTRLMLDIARPLRVAQRLALAVCGSDNKDDIP
jgi:hypothetical protein